MNFEDLKEWMNLQVSLFKSAGAARCFNDQIVACCPYGRGIHIYCGLDIIADVLGLELKEKKTGDPQFEYEYTVFYDGVRFYQIEEERLEGYGND